DDDRDREHVHLQTLDRLVQLLRRSEDRSDSGRTAGRHVSERDAYRRRPALGTYLLEAHGSCEYVRVAERPAAARRALKVGVRLWRRSATEGVDSRARSRVARI